MRASLPAAARRSRSGYADAVGLLHKFCVKIIRHNRECSSEWVEFAQVVPEQRIDDPPVATRYVLGDPCVQQQFEHPVTDRRCQPSRNRLTSGDRPRDLKRVLVESSDLLHGLLHRRQISGERRSVAELDEVEVDLVVGPAGRRPDAFAGQFA